MRPSSVFESSCLIADHDKSFTGYLLQLCESAKHDGVNCYHWKNLCLGSRLANFHNANLYNTFSLYSWMNEQYWQQWMIAEYYYYFNKIGNRSISLSQFWLLLFRCKCTFRLIHNSQFLSWTCYSSFTWWLIQWSADANGNPSIYSHTSYEVHGFQGTTHRKCATFLFDGISTNLTTHQTRSFSFDITSQVTINTAHEHSLNW